MKDYFEIFKKTGKINDYLKFKEEMSKELDDGKRDNSSED